jgi:hypothetical protein
MRIRLAAALHCSDGPYGNVTHVIVAPLARRITHLAVIEPGLWPIERLIPTSLIETGTQRAIVLRCTRAELERLIAHDELGYDRYAHAACTVGAEADLGWSLEFPEETALTVPRELVPPGAVAVHRYTRVQASDGLAGQVEEFLAAPRSGAISHLVLREGRLWGRHTATVPISAVVGFDEDVIRLSLKKQDIGGLPAMAARSCWW